MSKDHIDTETPWTELGPMSMDMSLVQMGQCIIVSLSRGQNVLISTSP